MKQRDTYHHGDLREALLHAADTLVAEAGVEALTLREVVRRAGVSTGAPYNHFADKAALVAALGRRHLDTLDEQFQAIVATLDDPQVQLRALGATYVGYALDHPAAFRLMFRPEKGSPFTASTDHAQEPVFGVLMRVVRACRAAAGDAEATDEAATLAAWSLVHGLAALLLDGPLSALAADRVRVAALVDAITWRIDVTG